MEIPSNAEMCARDYQMYRDQLRLEQGLWNNGTSACALGAFLGATSNYEAITLSCIEHMMPQWLVDATPIIFDYDWDGHEVERAHFHFTWADEVYAPGGLVDRAGQLTETERILMWEEALHEIITIGGVATQCRSLNSEARHFLNKAEIGVWVVGYHFKMDDKKRAAGTIIDAVDAALTKRGV